MPGGGVGGCGAGGSVVRYAVKRGQEGKHTSVFGRSASSTMLMGDQCADAELLRSARRSVPRLMSAIGHRNDARAGRAATLQTSGRRHFGTINGNFEREFYNFCTAANIVHRRRKQSCTVCRALLRQCLAGTNCSCSA